jgi:peptidoglycan/LPS O-acetylase OafA/YrhL
VVLQRQIVPESQLGKVRYVAPFDGIRGLGLSAVIAFHVVNDFRWMRTGSSLSDSRPGGWLQPCLENLVLRGWCSVDVFFVLSGFLITWLIAAEIDNTGAVNLQRFYARRALRLQPAYLSALVGCSVLLYIFHRENFFIFGHAAPYLVTYTMNIALALGFIALPPLGQAWSLCIEEQFYLCWALTLRCFSTRTSLRIALVVATLVAIHRSILYASLNWPHLWVASPESLDRIYYGTDTRIDTILVGCAAALALREPRLQEPIKRLRDWPWFTTLAATAVTVVFAWATGGAFKGGWRAMTIGYTLIAITTAMLIVALFLQPRSLLSRCLAWKPIAFAGRVSYGAYLFHYLFWHAVGRVMHFGFGTAGTLGQELAAFLIVWSGSVAVAWLHYQLIERPFLAMRERFDSKETRAARSVPASGRELGNSPAMSSLPGSSVDRQKFLRRAKG